jgi:sortase (surface protein transpeptidase)
VSGVRSRVLLLSAVVAILVAATPPTTSSATIQRTWTAAVSGVSAGGAAASGTAVLVRYWAGNGSFSTHLEGLRPSAKYAVAVYRGTCSRPTVLLRLPNLATDANGNAAATTSITPALMAPVWRKAADGAIALRIRAGADVRCAPLTYPVATRVAVPSLGIDLPVVFQRGNAFPWCNVAMYLPGLSQPGEAGVSFLYAHARSGMFLPLLNASLVTNGTRMLGMKVYVWTSDDRLYTYQVTRVRRHQYTLPDLWSLKSQQVWLQTSEGPYGTKNKLMVVAQRIAVTTASHAAAHPRARPVVCGLYG